MTTITSRRRDATVLVASANTATRVFITVGLAPDGYTVYAVDRVADAQLRLHHEQPDIAIIDADLPRALALARSFLAPTVPVVLLTGARTCRLTSAPLGRSRGCANRFSGSSCAGR